MQHEISSIPFIGGAGTVRDDVLAILSAEFPLSAKELFVRVKKEHQRNVTYQAVHKTLLKLVETHVLEKNNSKYQISSQWVNQVKDHMLMIEQTYQGKNYPFPLELKKPLTLHFTDYTEACMYMGNLLAKWNESRPSPVYAYIRHAYWPLRFHFSDYQFIRRLDGQNPGNRVVITQKEAFDQWIANHYSLICHKDAKLVIGVNEPIEEDILFREDNVIQVTSSTETKEYVDKIFKQLHGLTDLFKLHFSNKLNENQLDITVTVSRNPVLAKLMKEKIKSYFGE